MTFVVGAKRLGVLSNLDYIKLMPIIMILVDTESLHHRTNIVYNPMPSVVSRVPKLMF